jgi:hypothetical protein
MVLKSDKEEPRCSGCGGKNSEYEKEGEKISALTAYDYPHGPPA